MDSKRLRVRTKAGAAVRSGPELQSAYLNQTLSKGTEVLAVEERWLEKEGLLRMRIVAPINGWVTARCLSKEAVEDSPGIETLKWLERKLSLESDALLVGDRCRIRQIALDFVGQRDFEYAVISCETCGSHLKQRLELGETGATRLDGPATSAARRGAILILDGVDRADANVLPILNELLENRRLPLDDGSLLCASPGFACVALAGHEANLDPTLRSRFAARRVPCRNSLRVSREISAIKNLGASWTRALKRRGSKSITPDEDERAGALISVQWRQDQHFEVCFELCGSARCAGGLAASRSEAFEKLVASRKSVVRDMIVEHCAGTRGLAVVGTRGSGKTNVTRAFAELLGYEPLVLRCHGEMCARDMLQTRSATAWISTPVVNAARMGRLVVIENCEALDNGVFEAALETLLDANFVVLPDGSLLKEVPTSFQLVATCTLPLKACATIHELPELSATEEVEILSRAAGVKHTRALDILRDCGLTSPRSLDKFGCALRDANFKVAGALDAVFGVAIRWGGPGHDRLKRAAERAAADDEEEDSEKEEDVLNEEISTSLLSLPAPVTLIEQDNGTVKIGRARAVVGDRERPVGMRTSFTPTPGQAHAMERLLVALQRKQRILLIGPQGVGKNMIVNELLHLLRQEQEYVQLHRDSTASSLTLCVEPATLDWLESPLVRAARRGCVAVIDEADKAPPEVVAQLRAVLEDPTEVGLPDGTRLARHRDDFDLIVLANRPGFPFQGHDFFGACGDLFDVVVMLEAPDDPTAELSLLSTLAPSTPLTLRNRLAAAFVDLRRLADAGHIAYPYSTRDLCRVARHLRASDSLSEALEDVTALDSQRDRKLVDAVFRKHKLLEDTTKKVQGELLEADESADCAEVRVDSKSPTSAPEVQVDPDACNALTPNAVCSESAPCLQDDEATRDDDDELTDAQDTEPSHAHDDEPTQTYDDEPTRAHNVEPAQAHADEPIHRHDDKPQHTSDSESTPGPDNEPTRAHDDETTHAHDDNGSSHSRETGARRVSMCAQNEEAVLASLVTKSTTLRRLCEDRRIGEERSEDTALLRTNDIERLTRAMRRRLGHERIWVKRQTRGELDDSRIVDAVLGETAVYRRRITNGERRLVIKVVLDVSATTYDADALDGRLTRLLSLVVTLCEALQDSVDLALTGFSGSGPEITFKRLAQSLETRRTLVRRIATHAQYCRPGDSTFSAARAAIAKTAAGIEESTDRLVILVLALDSFLDDPSSCGLQGLADLINRAPVPVRPILIARSSLADLRNGDKTDRLPPLLKVLSTALLATDDDLLGPALESAMLHGAPA